MSVPLCMKPDQMNDGMPCTLDYGHTGPHDHWGIFPEDKPDHAKAVNPAAVMDRGITEPSI